VAVDYLGTAAVGGRVSTRLTVHAADVQHVTTQTGRANSHHRARPLHPDTNRPRRQVWPVASCLIDDRGPLFSGPVWLDEWRETPSGGLFAPALSTAFGGVVGVKLLICARNACNWRQSRILREVMAGRGRSGALVIAAARSINQLKARCLGSDARPVLVRLGWPTTTSCKCVLRRLDLMPRRSVQKRLLKVCSLPAIVTYLTRSSPRSRGTSKSGIVHLRTLAPVFLSPGLSAAGRLAWHNHLAISRRLIYDHPSRPHVTSRARLHLQAP
jgi:hypothetical protein